MGWLVFSSANVFQFLMLSCSSSSGGDDGRGGGLHPQMLAGFQL
jgi:hypothetical protein